MTPSAATLTSTAPAAANAVAVDTWYVIEVSHVDLGHCTSTYWVERLEDINAFGVQAWKKARHAHLGQSSKPTQLGTISEANNGPK
jgi:hypothetical protein